MESKDGNGVGKLLRFITAEQRLAKDQLAVLQEFLNLILRGKLRGWVVACVTEDLTMHHAFYNPEMRRGDLERLISCLSLAQHRLERDALTDEESDGPAEELE